MNYYSPFPPTIYVANIWQVVDGVLFFYCLLLLFQFSYSKLGKIALCCCFQNFIKIFCISQVDDLSLRDNATNCLVTMVTQFSYVEYDQDVFREIIAQSLLPEVKKGVKSKNEVFICIIMKTSLR